MPEGQEIELCLWHTVPEDLRVVAPAPRAGQRWERPYNADLFWIVESDWTLSDGKGCLPFGSSIDLARWLLENDYTYAGEAPADLPAPPPVTSLEPLPPPAPADPPGWTREDSRRCVAMYMRMVEAETFGRAIAHVLGAVAEMDPLVDDAQVQGIVAGLRAWEARRSEVAPGVRRLRPEQRDACAAAARAAHAEAGGAPMPSDRSVSGEEVRIGDIYERARAGR